MIAVPIGGKFRVVTVASPEYLARNPAPTTPEELRLHNCVRYRWDKDVVANSWRFMKDGERVEVGVEGTLTVNDHDLALAGRARRRRHRAAAGGIGCQPSSRTASWCPYWATGLRSGTASFSTTRAGAMSR